MKGHLFFFLFFNVWIDEFFIKNLVIIQSTNIKIVYKKCNYKNAKYRLNMMSIFLGDS